MTYDPRDPNVLVTDMTEAEILAAFKPWTHDLRMAALREGWDIFDSRGSDAGPIQVQRIDDPEDLDFEFKVPYLENDDHAMLIVRTGTGEHHKVARQIIATHNPEDFERMDYIAKRFGKGI